jgi:hypothetical protein
MSIFGRVGVLVVALSAGVAWAEEDKEGKVDLKNVPRAVLKAVKDKFPKAKIVSASKEKENDKIVYELQIKNEGRSADVTVTPEGKITTVETTIDFKDLPKDVAAAFKKKYPNAKVQKTEEVGDGDKITAYEMLIVFGKKTLEVKFDPKGKFVAEEEKSEKKQDKNKNEKDGQNNNRDGA